MNGTGFVVTGKGNEIEAGGDVRSLPWIVRAVRSLRFAAIAIARARLRERVGRSPTTGGGGDIDPVASRYRATNLTAHSTTKASDGAHHRLTTTSLPRR